MRRKGGQQGKANPVTNVRRSPSLRDSERSAAKAHQLERRHGLRLCGSVGKLSSSARTKFGRHSQWLPLFSWLPLLLAADPVLPKGPPRTGPVGRTWIVFSCFAPCWLVASRVAGRMPRRRRRHCRSARTSSAVTFEQVPSMGTPLGCGKVSPSWCAFVLSAHSMTT